MNPHLVGEIEDGFHCYGAPCLDLVRSDSGGARALIADKVGSGVIEFFECEGGVHRNFESGLETRIFGFRLKCRQEMGPEISWD